MSAAEGAPDAIVCHASNTRSPLMTHARARSLRLAPAVFAVAAVVLAAAMPPGAGAQAAAVAPTSASAAEEAAALASWVQLDAATGYESRTASELLDGLTGWSMDRWGNVGVEVGTGGPHTVVACALDRPSLAVTQVTPDGYLRVHRIGRGSRHPLWDQAWEAQPVRILTRGGPVTGVVARSNGHFARQHRGEDAVVSADDLWIDVGADSEAEVAALGIELLDPVGRQLPAWTMAGAVAGPDAGRRVGCAAVATLAGLARDAPPEGRVSFVLSAQEVFGWVGLASRVARADRVDRLVVLAPGAESRTVEERDAGRMGDLGTVLESRGVASATWIAPRADQVGSHMEVVNVDEARALFTAVADALGMTLGGPVAWTAAPEPPAPRSEHFDASVSSVAVLLESLVERYGTPGHEWSVRRLVLESLPEWARDRAVVDDVGNVMVEAGPERDTTVFMAHMDEVGYEVRAIAPDGVVTLRSRGGAVSSAWEGQTALLHFDPPGAPSTLHGEGFDTDPRWKEASLSATAPPPLRGVFATRADPGERNPGALSATFGVDSVGLAGLGVTVGSSVTSYKDGLRMGRHRFVARALDDRAGTTALILAVRRIDPSALESKVIFTWSVHEEGGLLGAAAMARRYASSARRIYSVDTFVSSDTPLESPHFAFAPLGDGPVLRAIENSSVSPDGERDRVRRIARDAGIAIQTGLTQGGTDGTEFTFYGAPNQGLSWPGRYSHSPGEVLDLRDLARLAELIAAVATAGG